MSREAQFYCSKCEDTGIVTVRVTYPMSYICSGDHSKDGSGLTCINCPDCNAWDLRHWEHG